MNCNMPGSPVLTVFQSLLKFMSIESVMPSNHLILCPPLSFCLQSPSIRVFFNESALSSHSNEYSGLIWSLFYPIRISWNVYRYSDVYHCYESKPLKHSSEDLCTRAAVMTPSLEVGWPSRNPVLFGLVPVTHLALPDSQDWMSLLLGFPQWGQLIFHLLRSITTWFPAFNILSADLLAWFLLFQVHLFEFVLFILFYFEFVLKKNFFFLLSFLISDLLEADINIWV